LKIWLVSRKDHGGYDTFDAFVTAANTEDEASQTYPDDLNVKWNGVTWAYIGGPFKGDTFESDAWVKPSQVDVAELGEAKEGQEFGVILASYNAG
jgi:hypothetical protein